MNTLISADPSRFLSHAMAPAFSRKRRDLPQRVFDCDRGVTLRNPSLSTSMKGGLGVILISIEPQETLVS